MNERFHVKFRVESINMRRVCLKLVTAHLHSFIKVGNVSV